MVVQNPATNCAIAIVAYRRAKAIENLITKMNIPRISLPIYLFLDDLRINANTEEARERDLILKMKPKISSLGVKFVTFKENIGLTKHIIRIGEYLFSEGFESWILWEDDKWIDENNLSIMSAKLINGKPTFVNTLNFYSHEGASVNEFRSAFFTPLGVAGVNNVLISEIKESLINEGRRNGNGVFRNLVSLFGDMGFTSTEVAYLAEIWFLHLKRGLREPDRTDSLIQLTLLEKDLLRTNSNLNLSLDLTSQYGRGLHQNKSMPVFNSHKVTYFESKLGLICSVCEKQSLGLKFRVGKQQLLKGLLHRLFYRAKQHHL